MRVTPAGTNAGRSWGCPQVNTPWHSPPNGLQELVVKTLPSLPFMDRLQVPSAWLLRGLVD